MKKSRKIPKNYDGTFSSLKKIDHLLPKLLDDIKQKYNQRPERIKDAWAEILGEKLAPFTKVISFDDGILTVQVKGSTLYSLLHQHEKDKILKILQKRFSKGTIRKITLRVE